MSVELSDIGGVNSVRLCDLDKQRWRVKQLPLCDYLDHENRIPERLSYVG
jgi:hypothetical protein